MTFGSLRRGAVLALVLSLAGCDDEVAKAPVVVAPGATVHGGTLVHAGPHPVEVVTHASGQIYAYAPATVADPASANLTIEVPVTSGRRPVHLRYDPREGRYEGRVARDTIVVGPLNVTYVVGGVTFVGFVAVIVIAPAIVVHVDGYDVHYHGKHKHKFRH